MGTARLRLASLGLWNSASCIRQILDSPQVLTPQENLLSRGMGIESAAPDPYPEQVTQSLALSVSLSLFAGALRARSRGRLEEE